MSNHSSPLSALEKSPTPLSPKILKSSALQSLEKPKSPSKSPKRSARSKKPTKRVAQGKKAGKQKTIEVTKPAPPKQAAPAIQKFRALLSNQAKLQLSELLKLPEAWTKLTREEKLTLVRMMPGNAQFECAEDMEVDDAPVRALKGDTGMKEACGRVQDDLRDGYYTAAFLTKAKNAMKRRAEGFYDQWEEYDRHVAWGPGLVPEGK